MIDPTIRRLSRDDLEAALTLSSTAGWNQRAEDWRLLLEIAPAGSFAAVSADRIVGTAMGIDYGTFGWIAMMLVLPAFRGQGIGRLLLEAAMTALPRHLPIRLDATPMGRPLYEAHGFREEACLTRYLSNAATRRLPHELPRGAILPRRMDGAELRRVAARDEAVFLGNRRRVLQRALELGPEFCHALADGGQLRGYCFGRQGRVCAQIGPVVADDARAARSLTAAALEGALEQPVFVDAFDNQLDFTAWLRACGFEPQRPLYRMCRAPAEGGGLPQADQALVEHAILGPEFA